MYVNFLVHIIGDHANDDNILGRRVHVIRKNTEVLVSASKEIGLEVNGDKTKYMVMSGDENAGRSHNVKLDTSCFERVEQFRCLGTALTDQNSIPEENKCRLKSQNACYHSVQNTVYETAHLKVLTDFWMYPVLLFASIFPYSKHKGTDTCCLCAVHSVLKGNKLPVQTAVQLQYVTVHSYCCTPTTV